MKISQPAQFKRDVKQLAKRGKDLGKLKSVIELLVEGSLLPPKLRDHALAGDRKGWRDCHIEPDWLLIYKLLPDELVLGRTGSHSDLF
jgi:mRNA interferase YafQ